MSNVIPADLAYGLKFALEHGQFCPADAQRLRHLLCRWDAQQRTPDPGAAIVRQWNSDRGYFLKTLEQLDSEAIYHMAEAAVAFHKRNDARTTLTVDQQLAAWQRAVVAQHIGG